MSSLLLSLQLLQHYKNTNFYILAWHSSVLCAHSSYRQAILMLFSSTICCCCSSAPLPSGWSTISPCKTSQIGWSTVSVQKRFIYSALYPFSQWKKVLLTFFSRDSIKHIVQGQARGDGEINRIVWTCNKLISNFHSIYPASELKLMLRLRHRLFYCWCCLQPTTIFTTKLFFPRFLFGAASRLCKNFSTRFFFLRSAFVYFRSNCRSHCSSQFSHGFQH